MWPLEPLFTTPPRSLQGLQGPAPPRQSKNVTSPGSVVCVLCVSPEGGGVLGLAEPGRKGDRPLTLLRCCLQPLGTVGCCLQSSLKSALGVRGVGALETLGGGHPTLRRPTALAAQCHAQLINRGVTSAGVGVASTAGIAPHGPHERLPPPPASSEQ